MGAGAARPTVAGMRPHHLLAGGLSVAAAAAIAAGASAATTTRALPAPAPYERYTLSGGRTAIAGAPGATGFPRASVLVPGAWKRLARTRSTLTLRTSSGPCPFTVRFSVRMTAGPAATATAHVTAALPAATRRHVEDEGTRRTSAWRVVRRRGPAKVLDGMQAYATSSGVSGLTSGRAWMELVAGARAGSSGECHAGTYRTVARQIGDAISVSVR